MIREIEHREILARNEIEFSQKRLRKMDPEEKIRQCRYAARIVFFKR